MALLDCLGSVMVYCACSNCLHLLGNRHVYEFIRPMICNLSALCNINPASRAIVAYCQIFGPQALFLESIVNWSTLYSSLILATLLWCTILIIFRILRVGGAARRIHIYQRVIEMLVESASVYSAVLVILVVLEAHNAIAEIYIEELATAMRVRISNIFYLCSL